MNEIELAKNLIGCVARFFPVNHGRNLNGAKFKLDQKVTYTGKEFQDFYGKTFVITGINHVEEQTFEYSLEGIPWLVWEYELQEI